MADIRTQIKFILESATQRLLEDCALINPQVCSIFELVGAPEPVDGVRFVSSR